MKLKKLHILGSVLAGAVAITTLSSNSTGITGRTTVGCGGGGCHGTQSTATIINLTGLPSGGYVAGTTYLLTLTVTNTTESRAGFDLTVNTGTLAAVSGGTMAMGTEIHHTTPQNLTSGTATWTFNWTAPTTGNTMLTVNVAGNTVNGNGSADANDHWNLATFTANKANTSVANFKDAGFSIFPNPANDQLVLTTKGAADVHVAVFGMNGAKAATEVTKLATDKYKVNTANLAAGTYILSLDASGKQYATRFVKN